MALSQYHRLIICHRSVVSSAEFHSRLQAILAGSDILPPHTGALVKKTILYFDQHVQSHISRLKLAEAVNVNEDYLSRIFHREMGLSLWDYLNRLRVYMAAEKLIQTDETIQEIAFRAGFQDHAYFNRVFRKIYGIPPGELRKQQKKPE
jgi:transcriptional regulator GlxA family with amidase domain